MGREQHPYRIKQRSGVWYYKLHDEKTFHTSRIPVNNPKTTRRKAEKFCENLLAIAPAGRSVRTFGEYAEPYFLPGSCPWFKRQANKGKHLTEDYRDQHRSRLDIHILPVFKDHRIDQLSSVAIEDWIFDRDYSSQTKKHIYNTMMIILRDMRRDGLISFGKGDIEPPAVQHKPKDILSPAEAIRLFPLAVSEFRAVWGSSLPLGIFLATLYSTGLRTSEARALVWNAVNWEFNGLKVIQTINKDGRLWVPKGKAIRVVPLPDYTVELLRILYDNPKRSSESGSLIFPGRTKIEPLDIGSAAHAMKRIRKTEAVNISANVTPHGLRHTYNTRMREILADAGMSGNFSDMSGFLSATEATDKILRAFTGHKSPDMTELYDHPELDKKIEFINRNFREYVNLIWTDGKTDPPSKKGADNGKGYE